MILCCGEALIDMVPGPMDDGQPGYLPCPGGAVFNTAIALGRLDAQVSMLSGVSQDTFGQQLADTLRRNKVETDLLVRSDLLTTLAVVHLRDGHATYSFYDDNSAGRMLSVQDMPPLPPEIDALYLGGISLVAEPAADAYADLLEREGEGRVVMLDPNIRPSFIADPARYRARLNRMIARSDIVKVSDEDLAWLTGGGCSIKEQAQSILAKGPRFVIVTLGAEGAIAISNTASLSQPAVQAEVADTIGAGDTFNAGFLAALQQKRRLNPTALEQMDVDALQPALALATQVAAVTVSRIGANPPWAHEL